MNAFFLCFASVLGGLFAAFVGGAYAHALAKRNGQSIDFNDLEYRIPLLICASFGGVVAALVHYQICLHLGVWVSVVSLILTLPTCIAMLIALLHGPYLLKCIGSVMLKGMATFGEYCLSMMGGYKGEDKR